nr:uncharacterized protein I203_07603 [Kwoniella mangroviensis CBS 8507]OCF63179.1 hypothetical protein I203_07603 [Kwoniella mangroviensis CBS 8507]
MSIPVQSTNKVSFTDFITKKCKEQPFVPIGCLATVGALLGATYHLRKGNRNKFNQFLRLRVYAQGATVIALMIYGEIPADTYYPGRLDVPKPPKNASSSRFTIPDNAPPKTETDFPTSLPESLSTAVDAPPSLSREGESSTGPGGAYPLRKEERMKVSDFARRLKEAEQLHKEEEAAKRARS